MSLFPDTQTQSGLPAYTVAGNLPLQTLLRAALAIAIAEFEGFFNEGSISQRANNPGNIRPLGDQNYIDTSAGRFRLFPNVYEGWLGLVHQINVNLKRGLTLEEFFLGKPGVYPGYSPIADNDPDVIENYIQFVSDRTGIARNLNLKYYFPDLVKAAGFSGFLWVPQRLID